MRNRADEDVVPPSLSPAGRYSPTVGHHGTTVGLAVTRGEDGVLSQRAIRNWPVDGKTRP